MMRTTIASFLALAWIAGPAQAQSDLRSQEIEEARTQKERQLQPDAPSRLERDFVRAEKNRWVDLFLGGVNGFRIKLGGMTPGSGIALGPEYTRRDLRDGNLYFRVTAEGSTKRYYLGQVQLGMPQLWGGRAFLDLSATHRDYAQMPYYGPGPDSQKTGRSDYRLEDTLVELRPGVRPVKHLAMGLTGAFLAANVGPGASSVYISTDRQFGPSAAPGIDRQTSFWRSGGFIQYDWRDSTSEPTSGGNYQGQYLVFSDRELGRYGFNRLDLEVQQYVPLLNHKRVIALRGRSSLADAHDGQIVPFYLQSALGGPETLRGFRPFRFYGDNMVVVNAEYRWEASTALDVVLFADGGKVFDKRSQWNLHRLESDVGCGFRFKAQQRLALRIDTGFSHEGFKIWLRFNNVF